MKRRSPLPLDEQVALSVRTAFGKRTAFDMHRHLDGSINKQSKLPFMMMSKLDSEIYIGVGNTIYESMYINITPFIKGTLVQ